MSRILQLALPVGQITATLAFASASRTIPSLASVIGRVSAQRNFTRNPAFTASCALHSTQERADNRYQAAVEVVGADGAITRAVLDTVNGYSFTPLAAVVAARRVLAARRDAGWAIKHVIVDNVWRTGDPSVLAGI